MTLTLHEATIPSFSQTIGALGDVLAKGRAFCAASGLDPETLASTQLYPDMQPLRFQVRAALHFSLGALDALASGRLDTPRGLVIPDYAGLEALVDSALARLALVEPQTIDDHAESRVVFHAGERRPVFTGRDLLLSFALPNLHFHASIAYALMRMSGVPLAKRDYLGRLSLAN